MDPIERICRYVYGELAIEALHSALVEAPYLEEVLGKTEYRDLLGFDPRAGGEHGFRRATLELFDSRLPGSMLKARARRVCEQMLSGEKDVVAGVYEMSMLRHSKRGEKLVPQVFEQLDSETLSLVALDQESNWDPAAFAKRRVDVEAYKPDILAAAREFLAQNPP